MVLVFIVVMIAVVVTGPYIVQAIPNPITS